MLFSTGGSMFFYLPYLWARITQASWFNPTATVQGARWAVRASTLLSWLWPTREEGAPDPLSHKGATWQVALEWDWGWPGGPAAPSCLIQPSSQRVGREYRKYSLFHSFVLKREWKMKQVTLKLIFIFSVRTFKTRGARLKERTLRKAHSYQDTDGLGST